MTCCLVLCPGPTSLIYSLLLTILRWIGLGRKKPTKMVILFCKGSKLSFVLCLYCLPKVFLVTCLYLNFYLLRHTRCRLCKSQVLWQKTCIYQHLLMKELRILVNSKPLLSTTYPDQDARCILLIAIETVINDMVLVYCKGSTSSLVMDSSIFMKFGWWL